MSSYIDKSLILEIVGGEPQEAQRVLVMLFDMIREQVPKLREAIDAENRELVASAAHRLSGSVATCGMESIGQQLRDMEARSALAPFASLREQFEEVERAFQTAEVESATLFTVEEPS